MQARDLLRRGPLFSHLELSELTRLARHCRVRALDEGETVVRAEARLSHLVYLASGSLELTRRNASRDITLLLGIVVAPSLVGDAEWGAGVPWQCTVRAVSPAECVLIPVDPFAATVRRNAELAFLLYRDASARHMRANVTAQTMALYDIEARLLRLLLDYAAAFGEREGNDVVLRRRVTLVDLAEGLGVHRRTIDRTLKPLIARGVVERTRSPASFRIVGVETLRARLPRDIIGLTSMVAAPLARS